MLGPTKTLTSLNVINHKRLMVIILYEIENGREVENYSYGSAFDMVVQISSDH